MVTTAGVVVTTAGVVVTTVGVVVVNPDDELFEPPDDLLLDELLLDETEEDPDLLASEPDEVALVAMAIMPRKAVISD